MQILIIYQLSASSLSDDKNIPRLKEMLKAKGFDDSITGLNARGEKIVSALPLGTLYKERGKPKDARAELKAAAQHCGLTIECCIAVEMMEWSATTLKRKEKSDSL